MAPEWLNSVEFHLLSSCWVMTGNLYLIIDTLVHAKSYYTVCIRGVYII